MAAKGCGEKSMKHFYIDPETLLGGIVYTDDKQEIVHLSLLTGNTVPDYQYDGKINLLVMAGKIELTIEEPVDGNHKMDLPKQRQVLELGPRELVVLEKNTVHRLVALTDSQVLVVKIK